MPITRSSIGSIIPTPRRAGADDGARCARPAAPPLKPGPEDFCAFVEAAHEAGFADVLVQDFRFKGRKLTSWEVDALFVAFEKQAHWKPLVEKARNKMASRDLAFRDALHLQLQEYVTPLQRDEFERFLGEKSKELSERLEEAKDVMKRLKERE